MSTDTLTLIAVLTAKPGLRDHLKTALKALVLPSRDEPGCLDYALFQLHDNPDCFYVRETWKDQAALDAHIALPHFQSFAARMDDLLLEPLQLIALEPVEP
ncbi:quinol monooxygenase YgiN [Pseudomonas sp. TE3786]